MERSKHWPDSGGLYHPVPATDIRYPISLVKLRSVCEDHIPCEHVCLLKFTCALLRHLRPNLNDYKENQRNKLQQASCLIEPRLDLQWAVPASPMNITCTTNWDVWSPRFVSNFEAKFTVNIMYSQIRLRDSVPVGLHDAGAFPGHLFGQCSPCSCHPCSVTLWNMVNMFHKSAHGFLESGSEQWGRLSRQSRT